MIALVKRKVPIKDFVLKLKGAVIDLIKVTKDMQKNIAEIQKKLNNIETMVSSLDRRVSKLEDALLTGTPITSGPETVAVESRPESEIIEEPEFIDLAKELGVELSEARTPPEEIPTPPPAPPIEEIREKSVKKPVIEPPEAPKVEVLSDVREARTDELKKEKDELLKALEELDII